MATFKITMDQVNGLIVKDEFFVDADNKIECADLVNARYSAPKTMMYSMHEQDTLQNIERLMGNLFEIDGFRALDFTNSLLNN